MKIVSYKTMKECVQITNTANFDYLLKFPLNILETSNIFPTTIGHFNNLAQQKTQNKGSQSTKKLPNQQGNYQSFKHIAKYLQFRGEQMDCLFREQSGSAHL